MIGGEGVGKVRRLRRDEVSPEACPKCGTQMVLEKVRLMSASFKCPKCGEYFVAVYNPKREV